MFRFRWMTSSTNYANRRKDNNSSAPRMSGLPDNILDEHKDDVLSGSVVQTTNFIYNLLGKSDDFVMRKFQVFGQYPAALCYLSSLSAESKINTEILKPLMSGSDQVTTASYNSTELKTYIAEQVLFQSELRYESRIVQLVESILRGHIIVVIEQLSEAFILGARQIDKRSIDQPQTEQVIQGPREGFIEALETNLALMRYRLPTPDFRIRTMQLGRLTKSKVAICYIEGIVNPLLVDEVEQRLSKIDIDVLLDAGYIEQYIQDNHLSPFPQVQNTERPDKAVASLAEGRIIILVDGSPFGLIVPSVFSQFFQTTEDYTSRQLQGSFVRMARVVALVLSLIFPALYVSVISFNPELIPTEFAVAVAGGRAGVPFPSVIEVLIMEVAMEVLREATIRLPQQVGGALSIVGVLVIGQAAVSAGFASPITVVVIALTTIGSFATPAYTAAFALRMLRFPLIILAGTFGLYGIMIGLILICNHLLSLKSFGVPYMTPIVPADAEGMRDTVLRQSLWSMKRRPSFLRTPDQIRVNKSSEMQQEPRNILDPMNTQDERLVDPDANTATDHTDPSNSGHH